MIVIGCDHAGFSLKREILKYLDKTKTPYIDVGTYENQRGDYPQYAYKAARKIVSGEAEKGILVCGSGIGMSIAANKVAGIRCAVCSDPYSAKMSRVHNNANMLALGNRVVGNELAVLIVDTWLNSEYEGGRHQKRLDMIEGIYDGSLEISEQE